MDNYSQLLAKNIKEANEYMKSGNSSEAYKSLVKAAECALLLAKNSVNNDDKQKYLLNYKKIKAMIEKFSVNDVQSKVEDVVNAKDSLTEEKPKKVSVDNNIGYSEKQEETRQTVGVKKPEYNDSISPRHLSDYIGQPQAVTAVKDLITAAQLKETALPHILIYGSHGLGKTTFAKIMANEMNVNFVEVNPLKINVTDMISILKRIQPRDIIFIDEIHNMPTAVAESVLYSAMQDGRVTYTEGKGATAKTVTMNVKPFTLIGATTEIGKIARPFVQRAVQVHFVEYSDEVLSGIILRSFFKLGVSISSDNALMIAKRCRNNPRKANETVKRISDKALVKFASQNNITDKGVFNSIDRIKQYNIEVTTSLIEDFFTENGIDEFGLEDGDRELLRIIIKKYNGGPVSVDTLAKAMNENNNVIVGRYESYLIKKGFIKITRDGRIAMPVAYEVLGIPVPESLKKNESDDSDKNDDQANVSKYDTRTVIAALVCDEVKCKKVEELITYPDNVRIVNNSLDELFSDEVVKPFEETTEHLCKLIVDFGSFKRELICDSFLESRFATCMASVGFLNDIKAQSLELSYVSQMLSVKRYFPDFLVKDFKNRLAIIEMKNYSMMSYHLNIDKYEMLKKYCIDNGYGYAEIMKPFNSDFYVSVEQIKNAPINEKLRQFIYDRIEQNALNGDGSFRESDFNDYVAIDNSVTKEDIYTVLLNDRYLKNVDRSGTDLMITKN